MEQTHKLATDAGTQQLLTTVDGLGVTGILVIVLTVALIGIYMLFKDKLKEVDTLRNQIKEQLSRIENDLTRIYHKLDDK